MQARLCKLAYFNAQFCLFCCLKDTSDTLIQRLISPPPNAGGFFLGGGIPPSLAAARGKSPLKFHLGGRGFFSSPKNVVILAYFCPSLVYTPIFLRSRLRRSRCHSLYSTLFSNEVVHTCLLYTSPSPRDQRGSRMPSSA